MGCRDQGFSGEERSGRRGGEQHVAGCRAPAAGPVPETPASGLLSVAAFDPGASRCGRNKCLWEFPVHRPLWGAPDPGAHSSGTGEWLQRNSAPQCVKARWGKGAVRRGTVPAPLAFPEPLLQLRARFHLLTDVGGAILGPGGGGGGEAAILRRSPSLREEQ